jgi:glutaredoxin 3
MANVTIYIKATCPFCRKALATLNAHGQQPIVIDIAAEPDKRDEMIDRIPKGRAPTVPQIFINNEYIGGCDDLHAFSEDELKQKLGE